MKKVFFILMFIMSIFCTASAGYVIRGISAPIPYDNLKNYTLTFNHDSEPISAASMHTTYAPGAGKNTIVIIQSNTNAAYLFPISLPFVPDDIPNDVEVRDFHYYKENDTYVLCGSRRSVFGTRAFVATIDHYFNMQFMEYPVADMFYSMGDPNITTSSTLMNNYYLCGTSGTLGVIASVDRGTLFLTNRYVTDVDWEYHKIIVKKVSTGIPTIPVFIASGRNPGCTRIGFTTLNSLLAPINTYAWGQTTELRSHCVVSDDVSVGNAVILASSNGNIITLNPVTYPIPIGTQVREVRFTFPNTGRYWVQDIGTIRINDATSRISVVGFKTKADPGAPVHDIAWHGYVPVLPTVPMTNSDYYSGSGAYFYEHYKIRHLQGNDYTGGYHQSAGKMCALFGTPLTAPNLCGDVYTSYDPYLDHATWSSFNLTQITPLPTSSIPYPWHSGDMDFYSYCGTFKGGDPVLKSVMSAENESEIATSYDRITLKDIPANTGYQIYNTIGQLISTGVTTPDISTASLSKGVYILRLESGKTFKFVK